MSKHIIFAAALGLLSVNVNANLNFIYGSGTFQTISESPGGTGESGSYDTYTLITGEGEQIWDGEPLDGDSGCSIFGSERILVTSSCWDGPITMHCQANNIGVVEACSADYVGNHFEGVTTDDTDFIGISIGEDARCGGAVTVDTVGCTKENANLAFEQTGIE